MATSFEKLLQSNKKHLLKCQDLVRKARARGLSDSLPTTTQVLAFLTEDEQKQFRFHESEHWVLMRRLENEFPMELNQE